MQAVTGDKYDKMMLYLLHMEATTPTAWLWQQFLDTFKCSPVSNKKHTQLLFLLWMIWTPQHEEDEKL